MLAVWCRTDHPHRYTGGGQGRTRSGYEWGGGEGGAGSAAVLGCLCGRTSIRPVPSGRFSNVESLLVVGVGGDTTPRLGEEGERREEVWDELLGSEW